MEALEDIGFYVDLREFLDFLKDSMEEREFFKFEFTKTLSLSLIHIFSQKGRGEIYLPI